MNPRNGQTFHVYEAMPLGPCLKVTDVVASAPQLRSEDTVGQIVEKANVAFQDAFAWKLIVNLRAQASSNM